MGWGFTLLKVAHAATGFLLKNFTEENSIKNQSDEVRTSIGAMTFIRNLKEQKTYIQNNEPDDHYIYFSRVESDGSLKCAMDIIKGSEQKPYTDSMVNYIEGHITYSPVDSRQDLKQSIVTFTAEYILKDKTEFIEELKDSFKYELTMSSDKKMLIFSCKRKFSSFEISFTDRKNITYHLKDLKIDSVHDFWEARVEFPQGCSINYPFKDVRIDITIPEDQKQELRKLLLAQSL